MVNNQPADAGDARDTDFHPTVGKIPLRRKWLPTPVFLWLKNPMNRGAWQITVHGVAKSCTDLSTFHRKIFVIHLRDLTSLVFAPRLDFCRLQGALGQVSITLKKYCLNV